MVSSESVYAIAFGVLLIIAAVFCGAYTETRKVWWIFNVTVAPYREWAMPLVLVGVVLIAVGVLVEAREREKHAKTT